MAPHWLHTINSYVRLAKDAGQVANDKFPPVTNVEELKGNSNYHVVTPEQCLEMVAGLGDDAQFHFNPMQGGLHPKLAWESLKLFESKVLPHLKVKFNDNLLY